MHVTWRARVERRGDLRDCEGHCRVESEARSIDVGKLLIQFQEQTATDSVADFVRGQLRDLPTGQQPMRQEPQDVVLYGFGRIGRLLARLLIERMGGGERFRLRAIVTRPEAPTI